MKDNKAHEYYTELGANYLFLTRRYVRKYDELTEVVAEQILSRNPKLILDIGQGVGNIEEILLEKNKSVIIDCIDAEEVMVHVAKQRLEKYGSRVRVQHADIRYFKTHLCHAFA